MNFKNLWLLCVLFLFGSSVVQAQNVEAVRKSLKAYQGHVYGSGRRYDSKQEKWVPEPKALRDAQMPMYDAIAEYITERQGVGKGLEGYIIAPTGTGKTVIYAKVVEGMVTSSTSKVLIVVPSLNLVTQTYDELMSFTNIAQKDIGLVHTGKKEFGRRVTITTYASWARSQEFNPKDYDAVILDEAHRGLSELRQGTLQQYKHAIKIGLTATAEFSDTKQVGMVLGDLVYELSIQDAIEKLGLLASYRTILQVFEGIDLSDIPVTGDDYDEVKMGEWLTKHEVELAAIEAYKAYDGITTSTTGVRDQAVVYCSGIDHSEIVAKAFNKAGIPAIAIHSKMKKDDREKILRQFKDGNSPYKVLTNPNVLIEGFDAPELRMIINLRPTLSKVVALQRFGRLLRLSKLDPNKVGLAVEFIYSNSKRDKEGKVKQLLIPTVAGAGVRWNANKSEAERKRIEDVLTEKAKTLQEILKAKSVRIYTSQDDTEKVSKRYSEKSQKSALEILEDLRARIIQYNKDHKDAPIKNYEKQYKLLGDDVPGVKLVTKLLNEVGKTLDWFMAREVKTPLEILEDLRARIIQYNKDHKDAPIKSYDNQYKLLGDDAPSTKTVNKMLQGEGKTLDWLMGREVKTSLEILEDLRTRIMEYNKDHKDAPITDYRRQYKLLGDDVASPSYVRKLLNEVGKTLEWFMGKGTALEILEDLRARIIQYNKDHKDAPITNYDKQYKLLGDDTPSGETFRKLLNEVGKTRDWLMGREVKTPLEILEDLRARIIQYNKDHKDAPITDYRRQSKLLGDDAPADTAISRMLKKTGKNWNWLYGKTGGDGSGYLSSGLSAEFFARGGKFEEAVNAAIGRVRSMLPGDVYVSMKGIPAQDMAQLQRMPKVLRDRIYRFYSEIYQDLVPLLGEEALPYERMYDYAVSMATLSLGEGLSEDYREGLEKIETRYVEAFKEQLELSSRPSAIVSQQVHFLACLFALEVGKLVNQGLRVEEAMVEAFRQVTSVDGLVGLGSFVSASAVSGELGKWGIWQLVKNRKLGVEGAKKLLSVLSYGSLAIGMAAQESYGAYRQIQELNRVGSLAENVGYIQQDTEGLGNLGLLDFFLNPGTLDVGLLDQAYGEVGVRISMDRSPLAMMGELEYKLYNRAEYMVERMRGTPGDLIKQKLGLEQAAMTKNLRYALGHVNVVDTLVHTGLLMASSLVGSQVPWIGTVITLSLVGEVSRVYDEMRYKIDTQGKLDALSAKVRAMSEKDRTLAEKLSAYRGVRLTPEVVKELEPKIEMMRLYHMTWREEVEKQGLRVVTAYAEVYRRTMEYIRAMVVKRGLGETPEHRELDIAEDTVKALEVYGSQRVSVEDRGLEIPKHRVSDIDEALKTMHYSHLALESLLNVNWINSLQGAGCQSTVGCLEAILQEDEVHYPKRNNREIEEAKQSRIPLRLVIQDELLNVAGAYKRVDQLNQQRSMQKAIVRGSITSEGQPYSKTAYDIVQAALQTNEEKRVKTKAVVATRADVIALANLKPGRYEISIVATAGGSRNTGQTAKKYHRRLETVEIEEGERHEIRIPADTLKSCKDLACYLEVHKLIHGGKKLLPELGRKI